jgi:hypothetical protein
MKSIVYVDLPKAGLGNKLIVWARAYVFAEKYNYKLYRTSWIYFNIGPFIRRERKKRLYFLYLKKNNFSSILMQIIFPLIPKSKIQKNPLLPSENKKFYIYHFTWQDNMYDFFKENIINRDLIRLGIKSLLVEKVQTKIASLKNPTIGVHIRRGDYNLHAGKTKDEYFIQVINEIRRTANENLPVTIFTDGTEAEMKPFLQLGNVELAEEKEDILDIFELSNSKICILSYYSSFSFWSGFLCTNRVIIHPKEEVQFL